MFGSDCPCIACISGQDGTSKGMKFTQVMNASGWTDSAVAPNYYSTPYPEWDEDADVIEIPNKFRHIFSDCDNSEFAGMANPTDEDSEEESGLLTTDCGATTTITNSFVNMTNVVQKVVTIQTAMAGLTMKSSHVGNKTYYVIDRTGSIRPITTKAFYVQEAKQDLLGGRALVNADYRVILDKRPDIAGVYPVEQDGTIDPATSFPFLSEYSEGLFYLRTTSMSSTKYQKMSGYCLWHRRLGHCPNATIQKTIKHSIGLDDLLNARFDDHEKCPACMIGKSKLENMPDRKEHASKPLGRVYIDIFSSSVRSIEGHDFGLLITDDCTMYRWLYGMKTKDEIIKVLKTWYSDISELRQLHELLVVIRDNAGENKSRELKDFFESHGIRSYFSTAYEQWQNGLAESSINSLMTGARATMVESGLGGRFWFSAAMAAKDARNATYKARIKTTPWHRMHEELRNVSKFRAFGCRAYMYLNEERRPPGKHVPRAVEAINLGFATDLNTSGYKLFIPETGKTIVSNQVKFDERSFPYRKQKVLDQDKQDELTNILHRVPSSSNWVPYDKSLPSTMYEKVHYDTQSDVLILRLTNAENTYAKTTHIQYLKDILDRQTAFVASLSTTKGLPDYIDPNRPPKNYKDAMTRPDREEWATAYQKEFQGFKDRCSFAIVRPPPGTKILGTTTKTEYKVNNGQFEKRKVRMCVRGDQQSEGVDFTASDLYSPTLKSPEARLLAAIAAEHGCPLLKTDTRQAFLYGDMGEDKVYIRPPDWWPEPIPEGHVLLLLKSIYGTKQAARRWHIHISDWMEKNGYPAVNS